MINVPNDSHSAVLTFVRQNDHDKVFALFNLSPEARTVTCGGPHGGRHTDYATTQRVEVAETETFEPAWGWRVLVG